MPASSSAAATCRSERRRLPCARAWCWRVLAAGFDAGDPRRALAEDAVARHLAAAL
jgi:hypothetical protein